MSDMEKVKRFRAALLVWRWCGNWSDRAGLHQSEPVPADFQIQSAVAVILARRILEQK